MKKTIIGIFLVVAILVLILLIWAFFFDKDGVLMNGINSVGDSLNGIWKTVTGSTKGIIPTFGTEGGDLKDAQDGF